MPTTDTAEQQNARHWRERAESAELAARSAAELLRDTATRVSTGQYIDPGSLRTAARAIDDLTSAPELTPKPCEKQYLHDPHTWTEYRGEHHCAGDLTYTTTPTEVTP